MDQNVTQRKEKPRVSWCSEVKLWTAKIGPHFGKAPTISKAVVNLHAAVTRDLEIKTQRLKSKRVKS